MVNENAKEIKNTLHENFKGMEFPKEFEKDIQMYCEKEPKEGYGLDDCSGMIMKIAELRKVPHKVIAQEAFYMLLGQYLLCKYGVKEGGGHGKKK